MVVRSSTPNSQSRRRMKKKTATETEKLTFGAYPPLYSLRRKALEEPYVYAKNIYNEGGCMKQSNCFRKGKTIICLGILSVYLFGLAFLGFLLLLNGKPTYGTNAGFVDKSLNSCRPPRSLISDNFIDPQKLDMQSQGQIRMQETILEIYDRENWEIKNSIFNNTNSPQHKAKTWIMFDDKHFDGIDSINPKAIVQRYILALVYFAMDGKHWKKNEGWPSRNSILDESGIIENVCEETSECCWHGITCTSGTVTKIWLG